MLYVPSLKDMVLIILSISCGYC